MHANGAQYLQRGIVQPVKGVGFKGGRGAWFTLFLGTELRELHEFILCVIRGIRC